MKKREKKFYSKPQIKEVNLVPQEAVLLGCKTTADSSGRTVGRNNCGNRDNFCETAVS